MKEKKISEITPEDIKTKVIIYPTDTVYGIGANALDIKLTDRVYEIKRRARDKPVSVLAPSKDWIMKNFDCDLNAIDMYLPGPYTLVLKKKDPSFLRCVSFGDSVGIRMIMHDFQKKITDSGIPFITTSANVSGEMPASSVFEIPEEVREKADILIDGGKISGTPSKVIDLTGRTQRILRE